ncbi:restriction endonuclease subunit S [Burkholderiaceae bacterium]|nr:restriction endonuclease subunit S [Burkholderiaceae bacterium]
MSFKWVKLSDVCERITDGSHFSPKTVDEGFPYITVRDIDNDNINFESCKFVTKEDFSELSKNGCSPKLNDLLFSKDGTVGKVALVSNDVDFVVLSSLAILTPKLNLINPSFLFYVLKSPDFVNTAIGKKTGVAIRRIILKNLKDISVPLPSLLIQKKIVAKLDAIFAEIDKATAAAEANAKNAEALFQSYLTELFERGGDGWIERKLQEITTKIGSGATPKGGGESYKETGISLIRSMNVYDEGFFYPKLAFIDDAQAKELANVTVEEHDILLNITGASVARCCIVPSDILPARVNQHVSILRAKNNVINPSLLHLLIISPLHKRRLLSVGEGGGTTRQAITKAQLQEYVIRFPVLHMEQLKLIEKISEIHSFTEKIKSSFENKLKNFPILKQSILKQAFNGELVKE